MCGEYRVSFVEKYVHLLDEGRRELIFPFWLSVSFIMEEFWLSEIERQ